MKGTTKGGRYFGEWCIVGWNCCMLERCDVGLLYPGRSEGSHELKMWILCNTSELLLYHSELQLLFHISYYMATVVMVVS